MFDPAINRQVFRNWRHFVAFGLGSGLARYAPGTFGTLVAIPLFLVISALPAWLYAVTVIAAFALGVWICETVSQDLRVHDHGGIVFDEFVGYWITMFLVPVSWLSVLAGFALFRLFDIWKPWPIRWLDDHVQGGFGIMVDDVVAGVLACAAMHAIGFQVGG
ncbi:MAG: phosphatidylglycerophosphatase A [Gammaproteobacteria bacterium]|nr:phosphatidylglycerophosphatase A [Gammaproteobacteria bacterium]